MDAMVEALKPIIIFAMVLWGIETVVTMLIKDHKQAKRKRAREKRRLEYQDRRMANDAEHAKVTRAMRYNVLRRDDFHCVRCGRGREDGVKTADIDGVTLRRISVKDLMEGVLMPEDKVEGVELIRVDAAELTVTACVRAIS